MRILVAETNWAAMTAARVLADAGFRLGAAETAEEVIAYAEACPHDVVLLNSDLPDMDPVVCVRALRHRLPRLSIALIAPKAALELWLRAFDAGADEVIAAEADPRELVARLQSIARRRAGLAEPVARIADLVVDCQAREVTVGMVPLALTHMEYEILEFMALRVGSVVSSEVLMEHLYGLEEDAPSSKILSVFIYHIRQKIAAAGGGAGIIETIWGRGYVLADTRALRIAA
jgi:DNA-binding response OmpR family regulator